MSTNSLVQRALTNAWLESQGVPSLRTRWERCCLLSKKYAAGVTVADLDLFSSHPVP